VKELIWIASSKKDLIAFPVEVRREMGHALHVAQKGSTHPNAKPLRGYGGAGVVEVVEDFDSDTFRTVYTVRFAEAIYVLHAFQKKSKRGRATPKADLDLIDARLKRAQELHDERSKRCTKKSKQRRAAAMSSRTFKSQTPKRPSRSQASRSKSPSSSRKKA
jgi:phage-related protein